MNTEKMLMDDNFDNKSMTELSELKRRAEVVQAFLDGRAIQISSTGGKVWSNTKKPGWGWEMFNYRVKPERIEGWVNVYTWGNSTLHETNAIAASFKAGESAFLRTVHVREVEE